MRLLVVDPRAEYVDRLEAALAEYAERTVEIDTRPPDRALEGIAKGAVDCLVSAHALPADRDGLDLLDAVRETDPDVPFVLTPRDGDETLAGRAVAAGVTEYVPRTGADPPIETLAERVRAAVPADRSPPDRQDLYDVVTDPDRSIDEQIDRLLRIGLEHLDVEHAYFGRVDEAAGIERIVATAGEPVLTPGETVPIAETFCRRTVERDDPVTSHDLGADPAWRDDPAYEAHDLECYSGAKIEVDGEPYGAVCFVDRTPRARAFDEADRTFIQLLARLLSHQLDRRQYEQRLQRRNDRLEERQRELRVFKRALDEAAVGITIADATQPDAPLLYVNDAFEATTGYTAETALGRNCRFLQGPDTDPATVDTIRDAMAADRPVSVEIKNYRADGEPFWNRLTVTPVRDPDGEVIRYIGFQRDVTERKRRVDRLEASEERFRSIVETTYDPVFRVDVTGTITYLSPAIETVTDHDPDTMIGADMSSLVAPGSISEATDALERVLEGEPVDDLVLGLRRTDGSITTVEVRATPFRRDGEVVGAQGIIREIADRERRRRTISVLNRALRHNLRNDTNVLLAHAGRIVERTDDATVADSARAILDRTHNLIELSEKGQTLRSVTERDTLDEVDVAAVTESAAAEVASAHPEVSVGVETPGSATAVVDPAIREAIGELLSNAVEHNDADDLSIDVTVSTERDRLRIVVADDGCGIPDVERIVLDRTEETALEHGSGLGLRLVNEIVERAGGTVEITPNDPTGTVVTLTLPRPESSAAPDRSTDAVAGDD